MREHMNQNQNEQPRAERVRISTYMLLSSLLEDSLYYMNSSIMLGNYVNVFYVSGWRRN